jgi:hypothetical protein
MPPENDIPEYLTMGQILVLFGHRESNKGSLAYIVRKPAFPEPSIIGSRRAWRTEDVKRWADANAADLDWLGLGHRLEEQARKRRRA